MKKHLFPIMILVFALLTGCGNKKAVEAFPTFKGTQPTGVNSLKSFPRKLWGDFVNPDGTLHIIISKQTILQVVDYDIKLQRDSLLKEAKLIGNAFIEIDSARYKIISMDKDSILFRFHHQEDILFRVSDVNILKKYKGYYFLNFSQDSDYWSVKKMELHKGVLTISQITSKEEINKLHQITESKNDSMTYRFNITRKQFKEFLKNEGFKNQEHYTKIRR